MCFNWYLAIIKYRNVVVLNSRLIWLNEYVDIQFTQSISFVSRLFLSYLNFSVSSDIVDNNYEHIFKIIKKYLDNKQYVLENQW